MQNPIPKINLPVQDSVSEGPSGLTPRVGAILTESRPTLYNGDAVAKFRRRHRIDPQRIRKMRFSYFQRHDSLEDSLARLGEVPAARAYEEFNVAPLSLFLRQDSTIDPSAKLVLETHDRERIETVLLRSGPSRTAVCVSTQVGCQAGCPFCATARMGLRRNLSYVEILEQILFAARITRKEDRRLRNIVFMGMGEPLHNEENLHRAIELLIDSNTFNMPSRRITVSTVGVPDAMIRLTQRFPGIQIALSLHSIALNFETNWSHGLANTPGRRPIRH